MYNKLNQTYKSIVSGICGVGLLFTMGCTNNQNDIYQNALNQLSAKSNVSARLDIQIDHKRKHLENIMLNHFGTIVSLNDRCSFVNEVYKRAKKQYNNNGWNNRVGLIAIDEYNTFCENRKK
jgi:hypothetical protein